MAQTSSADGGRTRMANGSCKTPLQKWQFSIEIEGFPEGTFTKGEAPSVEFDEVTFSPAGSAYDTKFAGRAKYSDITLEKGVISNIPDSSIQSWINNCMEVTDEAGAVVMGCPDTYKKNIDIVEYDRMGNRNRTFRLYDAWVKTSKFGDYDGSSSDILIETITICYDYYRIIEESGSKEPWATPYEYKGAVK